MPESAGLWRPEPDGASTLGAGELPLFVPGVVEAAGVLHAAIAAIMPRASKSRLTMGILLRCVSRRVPALWLGPPAAITS